MPKLDKNAPLSAVASTYLTLVPNAEVEKAIVAYFVEIGALKDCANAGKCNGPCDSGYSCTGTHHGTCVCTRDK